MAIDPNSSNCNYNQLSEGREGGSQEYRRRRRLCRVGCRRRRRRQLRLIIMGDSAAIILEAAADFAASGFIFGEKTAKDHNYSFRSNFVTTERTNENGGGGAVSYETDRNTELWAQLLKRWAYQEVWVKYIYTT